jgi:tellurite resistance-related uncharacterized protein
LPYVLQHTSTSQIYTCMLVNHYRLEYYGVKFWNSSEEAEQEHEPFLHDKGILDPQAWQIVEMEESQMKISNVKLKNDPAYLLYWNESQRPEARKSE